MAPFRSRLESWGQLAGLLATGVVVWATSVGPHLGHRDFQPRIVAALTIALCALGWSAVLGLVIRLVIRRLNPEEPPAATFGVTVWFAPATILLLQFSLISIVAGLVLIINATRLLCPPGMIERPVQGVSRASGIIACGELLVDRLARHFALAIIISAGFQGAFVAIVMHRRLAAACLLMISTAMLTALAISIGAWVEERPRSLPASIMGLVLTVLLALTLGRTGGGSGWGLGLGSDWAFGFHSDNGAPDGASTGETTILPVLTPASTGRSAKRPEDWPEMHSGPAVNVP